MRSHRIFLFLFILAQKYRKHNHDHRENNHGKQSGVKSCGLPCKGQEFAGYTGRNRSDKGRAQGASEIAAEG